MTEQQSRSSQWLAWMNDYVDAARRFISEDPVDVASDEERELIALKMALYARALTLFEGALLLLENDRQLDFRIHSRSVIEATMYLIALDRNPDFVARMKDDDFKSKQSRAALHLNAKTFSGTDDVRQQLEEFVARGLQGAKAIQLGTLLEGSDFDRLYRSYRDICGDAAHVSVTALNRHYIEHPNIGLATLTIHPELDDDDFKVTMTELGISMTIATLLIMKVKAKTDVWDEFQTLLQRYRALASDGHDTVPPSKQDEND
ncbi:DUF5677 domain-containing protein [Bradyrhizobium sp. LVM 105]|uniref:DUF5677 domain-containing protein n=1 Tax=Bradyrhizobium sp. LVM 105 TaxID=2341115 RepID=UPI000F81391D|nr:DUF5677 domain-containing protein [Bradyrhizobium sp. LVM 105]RTE89031.1 hypothetical protein D6B98_33045 [Bradyrhizobium sp. LVM 105]